MKDDPEYFSSFISKDHFRTERWKMVARAKQWKTKMRKRHPGYFKMPEQERRDCQSLAAEENRWQEDPAVHSAQKVILNVVR